MNNSAECSHIMRIEVILAIAYLLMFEILLLFLLVHRVLRTASAVELREVLGLDGHGHVSRREQPLATGA